MNSRSLQKSEAEVLTEPSIVFVNRFFFPDHSATSQILSDLAFFLARSGRRVIVLTSRQRYEDASADLPLAEVVEGVRIFRVRSTRFGRGSLLGRMFDYLSFYIGAGLHLLRMCKRGDILVAKTDPPMIGIVCLLVARFKGCTLVNWVQDVFPEVAAQLGVGIPSPLLRFLIFLRDVSLSKSSMVVVIGERMRDYLVGRSVLVDRVRVIANWTDDDAVTPVRKEFNSFRRQWAVEDKFVVGYSGNLGRAHDISTIIEAATALRDEPGIIFLFVGGGKQFESLRCAIVARGLNNVLFKPYQPREYLSLSLGVPDLHLVTLSPSLEGFIVPSKFYGVAAAGRPVAFVGDPDGEIARLIERMSCGNCVCIGDSAGLVRFIRELALDPVKAQRLGENARSGLEKYCSKKHAFEAWAELVADVVGGKV